ncbi:glycosyltransferase [Rufibacter soli]
MIPKIIHYCWFGGEEIPDKYLGYIQEWKEFHPTWEIKRWDEGNFLDESFYYKNALSNKNWANVSNYARLKVLSTHGGIYLDTDVKVVKAFDDLLLYDCFLGFENGSLTTTEFWLNNAVIGAVPRHQFIHRCLKTLNSSFDGTERANESSPKLVTKVLIEEYNLKGYGEQALADGIKLFETNTFYPIPWNLAKETTNYKVYLTPQTYAVHMWGRTWFTKDMLLKMLDDVQFALHQQNGLIQKLKTEVLELNHELILADDESKRKEVLLGQLTKDVEKLKNSLIVKEDIIKSMTEGGI